MTISKRGVGVMASKYRRMTRKPRWVERELAKEPKVPVMGMIWQDEIIKSRKRREWVAFYAGCAVGAAILAFSYIFLMRLTGGVCP